MKTVRFATVVEQAGKPEPYTLWQDPDEDREFQKAVREQRVMTVLRESGKADKAIVGFLKKSNASYFVFPKGLDEFRDRRVVGLKYDLLAQPKAKGKPVRRTERKKPAAPKARPRADVTTHQAEQSAAAEPVSMPPPVKKEKAKPLHMFQVHARITGTVEKEMTIEAESGRAARQAVLKMIETAPVDFSAGTTRVRVTKVQRSTFKKS